VAVLATLHPEPIRLCDETSKVLPVLLETLIPGVMAPSATAGTPAVAMEPGDKGLLTNAVREAEGERHWPAWGNEPLVDLSTGGGPTSPDCRDASRDGESCRTAAEPATATTADMEAPSAEVEAEGPGDATLLADMSPWLFEACRRAAAS